MVPIWEKYMLTVDEAVQYFGIAVKKECARIRGVDHTLTWKIKILGKQVEYGIKQIIEYLIPASFLKEMKIRNRKRLEHRK